MIVTEGFLRGFVYDDEITIIKLDENIDFNIDDLDEHCQMITITKSDLEDLIKLSKTFLDITGGLS